MVLMMAVRVVCQASVEKLRRRVRVRVAVCVDVVLPALESVELVASLGRPTAWRLLSSITRLHK